MPNIYGKERPSKAKKPKATPNMLGSGTAKKAGHILQTRKQRIEELLKKAGG